MYTYNPTLFENSYSFAIMPSLAAGGQAALLALPT